MKALILLPLALLAAACGAEQAQAPEPVTNISDNGTVEVPPNETCGSGNGRELCPQMPVAN